MIAWRAGMISGNVTLMAVFHVPAPRMLAASSISELIISKAVVVNTKIRKNVFEAITRTRPQKLKMLTMGSVAPVNANHMRLIQPAFGPASRIHPTAPR